MPVVKLGLLVRALDSVALDNQVPRIPALALGAVEEVFSASRTPPPLLALEQTPKLPVVLEVAGAISSGRSRILTRLEALQPLLFNRPADCLVRPVALVLAINKALGLETRSLVGVCSEATRTISKNLRPSVKAIPTLLVVGYLETQAILGLGLIRMPADLAQIKEQIRHNPHFSALANHRRTHRILLAEGAKQASVDLEVTTNKSQAAYSAAIREEPARVGCSEEEVLRPTISSRALADYLDSQTLATRETRFSGRNRKEAVFSETQTHPGILVDSLEILSKTSQTKAVVEYSAAHPRIKSQCLAAAPVLVVGYLGAIITSPQTLAVSLEIRTTTKAGGIACLATVLTKRPACLEHRSKILFNLHRRWLPRSTTRLLTAALRYSMDCLLRLLLSPVPSHHQYQPATRPESQQLYPNIKSTLP